MSRTMKWMHAWAPMLMAGVACSVSDGEPGEPGSPGGRGATGEACSAERNSEGSLIVTCGDEEVAIEAPEDCSVSTSDSGAVVIDCGDASATLESPAECTLGMGGAGAIVTCGDQTITVPAGKDADECELVDNGNGTSTLNCPDSVTVLNTNPALLTEVRSTPGTCGDDTGMSLVSGYDSNNDGTLGDDEIAKRQDICDGEVVDFCALSPVLLTPADEATRVSPYAAIAVATTKDVRHVSSVVLRDVDGATNVAGALTETTNGWEFVPTEPFSSAGLYEATVTFDGLCPGTETTTFDPLTLATLPAGSSPEGAVYLLPGMDDYRMTIVDPAIESDFVTVTFSPDGDSDYCEPTPIIPASIDPATWPDFSVSFDVTMTTELLSNLMEVPGTVTMDGTFSEDWNHIDEITRTTIWELGVVTPAFEALISQLCGSMFGEDAVCAPCEGSDSEWCATTVETNLSGWLLAEEDIPPTLTATETENRLCDRSCWDGVDNDGDGVTDADEAECATTWNEELDGLTCSTPDICTATGEDGNCTMAPSGEPVCGCTDGEWADGSCCYDPDGDGAGAGCAIDDCNESDDSIHFGAAEICDGIDNDCDEEIDEDVPTMTYFSDEDGDGFGDVENSMDLCAPDDFYTTEMAGDCEPENTDVHPDAEEVCDGIDNNCNGEVDEGATTTYYADTDDDGYGDPESPLELCTPAEGYVDNAADCLDSNEFVNPDAIESCDDFIDNDCDGETDELECIFPE